MVGFGRFFTRAGRAEWAMEALHRKQPAVATALAARYQGGHSAVAGASAATSRFSAGLLPDALLSQIDATSGAALYPRFARLPDSANAFPYTPNPKNLYALMPDAGTKIAVSGLWIATTDLSNAMWGTFLRESGRAEHVERVHMDARFRDPQQPAMLALYLSLDDGTEFGGWLTDKLRTEYGLRVTIRPPHEYELKYAGLAGCTDLDTAMTANGRFEVGQADCGKGWNTGTPAAVDAAHIADMSFGAATYKPLSGGGYRPTLTAFDPTEGPEADMVSWCGASWLGAFAHFARAGYRVYGHRGYRIGSGAVRLVASEDS